MHIGQRTTCGNDFLFPSHGVPESITGRQVWQQASLFADPSPQSLEIFLRDGFSHWGPTSEERASLLVLLPALLSPSKASEALTEL